MKPRVVSYLRQKLVGFAKQPIGICSVRRLNDLFAVETCGDYVYKLGENTICIDGHVCCPFETDHVLFGTGSPPITY